MPLGYHEIAETNHRILNPFSDAKLMTVGSVCRLRPDQRLLDLACGKGEMLCRWAQHFGIRGLGVDTSDVFLTAARARAEELGVTGQVSFKRGDARAVDLGEDTYDLVSCIGATWIGGGLHGTLVLMRPAVRPGGIVLVGECYWLADPPPGAYQALHINPDTFGSLVGTLDRLAAAGVELVEMILADQDDWDRYVAAQWWTITDWLRANPRHPDASGLRGFLEGSRRSHLEYGRQYLGWGVFVGRPLPRDEQDRTEEVAHGEARDTSRGLRS